MFFPATRRRRILAGAVGVSLLALAGCGSTQPVASISPAPYFPSRFLLYEGTPGHNAVYPVAAGAPAALLHGVSWRFAEAQALPLSGGPRDQGILGFNNGATKTTQEMGNAVGVTVVRGTVYVEEDTGKVYALDAMTGKRIWSTSTVNENMGEPLVKNGLVIVASGDTGFSYSNVLKLEAGKPAVRGLGFAAIYALNAKTGKKVWQFDTKGEDMADPVVVGNSLVFGNGDGHVYALSLQSGKLLWKTYVSGFDSMSSANVWTNPHTGENLVYVGFSDPNYLYALDTKTGRVVWKQTVSGVWSTGMGDNSPAVATRQGIVVDDSVVNFNPQNHTLNLALYALNAQTGQQLWQHNLGRGQAILAFKAGVPMVHAGVVYVGDPNNGTLQAYNVQSGQLLWSTSLPAGVQDRASPVYYKGILYEAAGPYVFALDPKTGRILGKKQIGGRFGIINPVIVGGTMFLSNSWGWTMAVPLRSIYPQARV